MPNEDVLVLTLTVMQINQVKPVNVTFSLRSQCGWIEIDRPSQTFDLRVDVSKSIPAQFYLKVELKEYCADSDNFIIEESTVLLHAVTKIPKTWLRIFLEPPGSDLSERSPSFDSQSDGNFD